MARDRNFYRQQAAKYAKQEGVDPRVFGAQIQQESGYNPSARSGAGAIGIAQIVPKWHPGVDPTNPDASLKYAAHWMGQLYRKYGNYSDALSVYNSGRPWSVGRGIGETRNYVATILANKGAAPPVSTTNHTKGQPGAAVGGNTAFGGPATRPQALASFMLEQAQGLAQGKPFDLAGLSGAFQADKQSAANALHGADPGGQDPQDPRVKIEPSAPVGKLGRGISGKIIGTPGAGTHTLGNWESDRAYDEALPYGTPIRAPFDGAIGSQFGSLNSKDPHMLGLRVHVVGDSNEAYLAHLSKFAPGIKPGQRVRAGQVIGFSGSANGVNHLHEALKFGNPNMLISRT